ncbi:FHA domain-containing protein FhaB/FipA [Leucobacter denitrificans]|uniref:FHA domain-containing protein n=1 Tax=Leucobacter denitrificans TaxID=683042 RepID=A0A7G9S2T3_9MICO|nr:FHA domain-containing protein [Leucobacter denitrificans]QNN62158.1 FHA domain-containing protein [Leucobacter denitrificans]
MSELTLLILRVGFLLLLWFFIFAIVYALKSDLFGAPVRKLRSDGSQPPQAAASPQANQTQMQQPPAITPSGGALPTAGASGTARTLVITSGVASGTSIPLDDDFVSIGRSSDSTLVIVDEYTSTYHARLAKSGSEWILTDLDSTNGTKLAGESVHKPVRVPLYTPVTIGKTTFELRP